jgi:microcystin-dependent protein
VPDLQDNVAMGKSGTKALASTGGANTVAATGNVGGSTANATLSTAQLASHSHPGGVSQAGATSPNPNPVVAKVNVTNTGNAGSGQGHSHNMSATFSGTASSVVQPYLTIIYVIKT